MAEEREKHVADIVDLASAYYGSAVLFAAIDLDLFEAVERQSGGATLTRLSAETGHDARGLQLLLDACVAVGLMRKGSAGYRNTPASAATLVAGAPHDLRGAIRYNQDVYPAWGRLPDLVRTGKPVEAPETHLGEDAERTRRFVLAMHGRALGIGRAVVPLLPLQGCRKVLDLAGGPGTYAMLMAQAHEALCCVTVDLPAVSAVAQELVADAGLADRVTCRVGDYHTDRYEHGTYDAVTIFGALHQESPASILSILQRAADALRPGGQIMILDVMTDASHTSPVFSALFAVNMALTTHDGWVFADTELHAWLTQAGFVAPQTLTVPPPMPHWLVTAHKPA